MKQALGATSAAKRAAAWAILLIPAAVLQTFLISSLSWWHVPLVRLAVVGALATLSVGFLRNAILRAGESAIRRVQFFGLVWSVAFLMSGLLGRDPAGVVFGLVMTVFWARWTYAVLRRLESAAYSSGVRWYQGAPHPIPRVSARVSRADGSVVVDRCGVARIDDGGIFLLLPRTVELAAGEYLLGLSGAQMQIQQPAQLNLLWERSGNRGAGFRFTQLDQAVVSKPIGDWMNRLEGRGYEQMD